jgi:hypothetical protein
VRRIALATPYSEAIETLGAGYWKPRGSTSPHTAGSKA